MRKGETCDHARTEGCCCGRSFVDCDPVACSAKADSSGQASDAASHDDDVHPCAGLVF